MSTALNMASISRRQLTALVRNEARRSGSKMLAYRDVGDKIGVSPSWIQKFIKQEAKEPRITLFHNIKTAYDELCERVEAQNRADEAKLNALKGIADAALKGLDQEVSS